MANKGSVKKGEVRNPRGRPKGARNKRTVLQEELTKVAVRGKRSPLEFLMAIIENEKADLFLRMDAAKAALPYCHRKQPQMVEMEGKVEHTGVMVVPATEKHQTWEQRAAAAQAALKAEVRH